MSFLALHKKWVIGAFLILAFSLISPFLDMSIAQFFYARGNDPVHHFFTNRYLSFVFDYGPLPAHLTAIFATLILILSYAISSLKKWRNPCLILLLTYAMGAGLIINGVLKEYWGRPRPKQVEEFGGSQKFRPFYEPNFFHKKEVSKSFPCGHCAMGFYFIALILVGKRLHNRFVILSGIFLTVMMGAALSLTRMMQGGHFFTDILFAALVMWLTALAIDWLVYSGEKRA